MILTRMMTLIIFNFKINHYYDVNANSDDEYNN